MDSLAKLMPPETATVLSVRSSILRCLSGGLDQGLVMQLMWILSFRYSVRMSYITL
jgi:hypothetical protein